jgi:hypothetical protein
MGTFPQSMHLDKKFFWLGLGFSLSLFVPSFPPLLGASFNEVCQGFITSRVDRPITNRLPMIKHFGTSFSILFHLE